MVKVLPPLNPLRVFEVVARTQNLTAAANELRVTQSAVSRQIATLENYLGIALFRRERHGVALTQAGAAYADRVMPAFAEISKATADIQRNAQQGVLRVRTYTTFAAKWLIPHLPAFQALHPNIEVVISNGVPDVDFDRDGVDLAVQFGAGHWPRTEVDLLFPDEIEPVCSPTFAKQDLASLLTERLLVSRYRSADWSDWLDAQGLQGVAAETERMSFSSSVLTWQAAIDGLGVAIGQSTLLEGDYRRGTLVRPFGKPLRRALGHYLVKPIEQRYSQKVASFRHWLLDATEASRREATTA